MRMVRGRERTSQTSLGRDAGIAPASSPPAAPAAAASSSPRRLRRPLPSGSAPPLGLPLAFFAALEPLAGRAGGALSLSGGSFSVGAASSCGGQGRCHTRNQPFAQRVIGWKGMSRGGNRARGYRCSCAPCPPAAWTAECTSCSQGRLHGANDTHHSASLRRRRRRKHAAHARSSDGRVLCAPIASAGTPSACMCRQKAAPAAASVVSSAMTRRAADSMEAPTGKYEGCRRRVILRPSWGSPEAAGGGDDTDARDLVQCKLEYSTETRVLMHAARGV